MLVAVADAECPVARLLAMCASLQHQFMVLKLTREALVQLELLSTAGVSVFLDLVKQS